MYVVSVLAVAVKRGCYSTVSNLLKHPFKQSSIKGILHHCVVDTNRLGEENILERKRIISLLLNMNPALIHEKCNDNRTPLLYTNLHVSLIKHFANLGMDVHATDASSQKNVLHLYPKYMASKEYDEMVHFIHLKGESKTFHSFYERCYTPIYKAIQNLEVLDSTLDIFLSAKANFNSLTEENNSLLTLAIHHSRSERILASLIHVGADINQRVSLNRTALHWAAGLDNLIAVRVLIARGCDVNATDQNISTPLHLAVDTGRMDTHQIVQELVQAGADVNACNVLAAPLWYALRANKERGIEQRIVEYLKAVGAK